VRRAHTARRSVPETSDAVVVRRDRADSRDRGADIPPAGPKAVQGRSVGSFTTREVVSAGGLEPPTGGLRVLCSAN
jgi:hypothetical protein